MQAKLQRLINSRNNTEQLILEIKQHITRHGECERMLNALSDSEARLVRQNKAIEQFEINA